MKRYHAYTETPKGEECEACQCYFCEDEGGHYLDEVEAKSEVIDAMLYTVGEALGALGGKLDKIVVEQIVHKNVETLFRKDEA